MIYKTLTLHYNYRNIHSEAFNSIYFIFSYTEDVDSKVRSDQNNKEQSSSSSSLQTAQSKSAVHYLSISPPRIKVTTDESYRSRSKSSGLSSKFSADDSKLRKKHERTLKWNKVVSSNPELNLPKENAKKRIFKSVRRIKNVLLALGILLFLHFADLLLRLWFVYQVK